MVDSLCLVHEPAGYVPAFPLNDDDVETPDVVDDDDDDVVERCLPVRCSWKRYVCTAGHMAEPEGERKRWFPNLTSFWTFHQ